MHFPKSLTESQNFSEIIPTEVCVPPLLLAAVFKSPPEFPSFSLAANPSPGPPGVVTILRTLCCCCCQSGGDSWLSTCSQKCSTWHLGGRKFWRNWQNLPGGGIIFNFVDIDENSHSEYWGNLGISVTEKSRKHLKRASVFAIYVSMAEQISVL